MIGLSPQATCLRLSQWNLPALLGWQLHKYASTLQCLPPTFSSVLAMCTTCSGDGLVSIFSVSTVTGTKPQPSIPAGQG